MTANVNTLLDGIKHYVFAPPSS